MQTVHGSVEFHGGSVDPAALIVHVYAVNPDTGLGALAGDSRWDVLHADNWRPLDAVHFGSTMVRAGRGFELACEPPPRDRNALWIAVTAMARHGADAAEHVVHVCPTLRKASTETEFEFESGDETTETTRDSTDGINEITDTETLRAEAGGGAFGLSASAGYESSEEVSNKSTTSDLSEKMEKAASKLRYRTKTVVATETEQGFEEEAWSEIRNDNKEIAVT